MNKKGKKTKDPQFIVILRAVAGGYLLYLAWGLREVAFSEGNPVYLLALLIFVFVGVPLLYFSVRRLYRGEFLRPGQSPEDPEEDEPDDPALPSESSEGDDAPQE